LWHERTSAVAPRKVRLLRGCGSARPALSPRPQRMLSARLPLASRPPPAQRPDRGVLVGDSLHGTGPRSGRSSRCSSGVGDTQLRPVSRGLSRRSRADVGHRAASLKSQQSPRFLPIHSWRAGSGCPRAAANTFCWIRAPCVCWATTAKYRLYGSGTDLSPSSERGCALKSLAKKAIYAAAQEQAGQSRPVRRRPF
jgi:hypothetical protein